MAEIAPKLFIPPVRDFIFKEIFGDPNDTEFSKSLLQSTLDLPPEDYEHLEVADPNLQKQSEDGKLSILDLKLHTKNGDIIDIEIQTSDTLEIRERLIFNLAKTLVEQLHSGDRYKKLKRVIGIQITTFNLLKETEEPSEYYHNEYLLRNKRSGKTFSDLIELHLLELNKVQKTENGSSDMLTNWMRFIGAKTPEGGHENAH
jgi:predicted transposase/invertase (TIGR01784 family)